MGAGQRRVVTCIVGVAVLVAAACAGDDDSSSGGGGGGGGEGGGGSAEGTYTFGINAELSGPIDGSAMVRGVNAYVEHVNANGGIDGHTIEVVELDNAGDQSRAAANTTQLVTADAVTAIFGHLLSANCTASTAIAERYETPMACLSVAEANPYVYNLGPDNSSAAPAFVAAGAEVADTSAPQLAFAYSDTLTNTALSEQIPDAVDDVGGTLTTSQEIAATATDYSGPAAELVSSEPDVILITVVAPTALIDAIRTAGYDGPVISLEGSVGLSFFPQDDPNLYVMSVYQFPDPDSDDPAVQEYVEALSTLGEDLSTFASYSDGEIVPVYLTAAAVGDALERCGYPCPGPDLKEQLDETALDFGEIVPSFEYTADDHYPYTNWFLYEVGPDSAELVDTFELEE
jgi:branched-chain amino acid transport system substrate-binding protein